MSRDEVIQEIRRGLKSRSKRKWSVTGGRGTAYGWIKITSKAQHNTMTEEERAELGQLLGLDGPCHFQGVSIAASSDYYQEYIDRAHGRTPTRVGEPYWD